MPKPANDAKSTSIAPIEKAAEPPRPPPPFTVKSPVVAWTEPAGLIVVDQLGHRQSLRPCRPAHTATQDRLSEIAIGRGFGIQHDAVARPEHCAVPHPLAGVSHRRSEPHGYLRLSSAVIPTLMKSGVPSTAIDRMMIDNTRRYFEGVRPSNHPTASGASSPRWSP